MLTIAGGIVLAVLCLYALNVAFMILTGNPRMPQIGKGLAAGLKGFRDGMKGVSNDDKRP
jgi:sec-independent protein translocase protein TatA